MSDEKSDHLEQKDATRSSTPTRAYDPPQVEKLGSLRDLLAVKTGIAFDPSSPFPFAKK